MKYICVCIYIRNIRSSFSQWLHIDHNNLLERTDSNKSSLSDCPAVNWQHFTVCIPNFTHTYTHKYVCLLLCSRAVNGALSHQLVTYCYQMNCEVQISRAHGGVAKDFAIAFQGNWAGPLVKSTEKKCTRTNLEARGEASLRAVPCTVLPQVVGV